MLTALRESGAARVLDLGCGSGKLLRLLMVEKQFTEIVGVEVALGIESLERFVRREPLRLVHECVFGVLALESEPIDPRL